VDLFVEMLGATIGSEHRSETVHPVRVVGDAGRASVHGTSEFTSDVYFAFYTTGLDRVAYNTVNLTGFVRPCVRIVSSRHSRFT
jgi:hypothetical protein